MSREDSERDAAVHSPSILWREVERCPACEGSERRQVSDVASAFAVPVGESVVTHPAYHLWLCAGCGLFYKSIAIDARSLDRYYETLDCSPFEHDGDFPTDKVIHELLSGLPSGARVLDYGCSTARILKEHASRLDCYGVEGNGKAADIANQRGIKTTRAFASDLLPAGSFDFILLSDVYEHLSSPLDVVRNLTSLLRTGAKFAIVTGNADSIQSSRMGEHWYFRILGHLQMAGMKHFRWLAETLGLELVSATPCSHYRLNAYTRLRQSSQALAYRLSRAEEPGLIGRLLLSIPPFSKARAWPNEPSVTFRKDHLVVVFKKTS